MVLVGNSMNIDWYNLFWKIVGMGFGAVLIKMFLAPEDSWLEIVGDIIKGLVMWL